MEEERNNVEVYRTAYRYDARNERSAGHSREEKERAINYERVNPKRFAERFRTV